MKIKNSLQFRNLQITPPLVLAPMAGLTHTALRQTILKFGGVGLLSTEMLSATRLPSESQSKSPYLVKTENETPLSYQLLICRPEDVAPALNALVSFGAEAIDINLGCPAPIVRKIGAGSSLMEKPHLVRSIIGELRKRTDLPISAKIRLGNELNQDKLIDTCKMLEDSGIDLLTIHARLKKESFSRKPRWEWIAKAKDHINIPVVANGGVFSVQDARRCLNESNADGLMIGRAAAIKPWLFAEIAHDLFNGPPCSPLPLPEIYAGFIGLLLRHFAPERRLGRLKEFTHYFSQNFKFGHWLASAVQTSKNIDEAEQKAVLFFQKH